MKTVGYVVAPLFLIGVFALILFFQTKHDLLVGALLWPYPRGSRYHNL